MSQPGFEFHRRRFHFTPSCAVEQPLSGLSFQLFYCYSFWWRIKRNQSICVFKMSLILVSSMRNEAGLLVSINCGVCFVGCQLPCKTLSWMLRVWIKTEFFTREKLLKPYSNLTLQAIDAVRTFTVASNYGLENAHLSYHSYHADGFAPYCNDYWAPSQYKDRLIYVWWFPC